MTTIEDIRREDRERYLKTVRPRILRGGRYEPAVTLISRAMVEPAVGRILRGRVLIRCGYITWDVTDLEPA